MPTPVFYVPHLFADGFSPLFCILIRNDCRDDAGLLRHEQTHIEQQKRDGRLRWLWRYFTSKAWRQAYEVEAYKAQIAFYGPAHSIDFAVERLANGYRLDISEAQARALLA